jgi:hypothetical protein
VSACLNAPSGSLLRRDEGAATSVAAVHELSRQYCWLIPAHLVTCPWSWLLGRRMPFKPLYARVHYAAGSAIAWPFSVLK